MTSSTSLTAGLPSQDPDLASAGAKANDSLQGPSVDAHSVPFHLLLPGPSGTAPLTGPHDAAVDTHSLPQAHSSRSSVKSTQVRGRVLTLLSACSVTLVDPVDARVLARLPCLPRPGALASPSRVTAATQAAPEHQSEMQSKEAAQTTHDAAKQQEKMVLPRFAAWSPMRMLPSSSQAPSASLRSPSASSVSISQSAPLFQSSLALLGDDKRIRVFSFCFHLQQHPAPAPSSSPSLSVSQRSPKQIDLSLTLINAKESFRYGHEIWEKRLPKRAATLCWETSEALVVADRHGDVRR